ncbi:YqgE/AlgH family protein [Cellulomonas sp. CW35]|uniref:YqgE/AlgH family protein n=1 Tax=Cellulomonas sp. CW35 TaxID=3458249 RepID=UPI0040346C15
MTLSGRLLVAAPQLLDPNFHRTVVLLLDHNDEGAFGVVLNRLLPVEVDAVLPGWQDVVSRPDGLFQGGPVGLDGAIGVAVAAPAPPGRDLRDDPAGSRDELLDGLRGGGLDGPGSLGRPGSPDDRGEPGDTRGWGGTGDAGDVLGASGAGRDGLSGQAASGPGSDEPVVDRLTGVYGLVDLDADPTSVVGRFSGLRIFAGHSGWGLGQLEEEIAEGAWFVVPSEPSDVFTDDPETLWSRVLQRQGGDLAMLAHYPPDVRLN